MSHFERAEKIHPPENDDAVLRWNRCVRLLEQLPQLELEQQEVTFEDHDAVPLQFIRSGRATK
jgi:hypothetical protein